MKLAGRPFRAAFVVMVVLVWAAAAWAGEPRVLAPEERVPDALIAPGAGGGRYALVVEKTTQTLRLYEYRDGNYYLHHTLPVATGRNTGGKQYKGDHKTPDGYYVFLGKRPGRWLKPAYGAVAYPTDYPNIWDQRQGYSGAGILLHGTNRALAPRISGGCIRMNDEDILSLGPVITPLDTAFVLYETIRYKTPAQLKAEAERVKTYLKGIVAPPAASVQPVSLGAVRWSSAVDPESLRLFRHRDAIVAVFDHKNAAGVTRLFLVEKDGGYAIGAETTWPGALVAAVRSQAQKATLETAGLTRKLLGALPKADAAPAAEKPAVAEKAAAGETPVAADKPVAPAPPAETAAKAWEVCLMPREVAEIGAIQAAYAGEVEKIITYEAEYLGNQRHFLRLGPFVDHDAALGMANRAKERFSLDAEWVLPVSAPETTASAAH